MSLCDYVPWKQQPSKPVKKELKDPFMAFQNEMNKLMEGFMGGFGKLGHGLKDFTPAIEVSDKEAALVVRIEVPGIDVNKDLDISLNRDSLIIKGERRTEQERVEGETHYREMSYGSFAREIPLYYEIDRENLVSEYVNGIVTLTLPKKKKTESEVKKININTES